MTDDSSGMPWPPALFAEQMQEAGEQAVESQQELMKQFMSATGGASFGDVPQFPAMTMGTATFKTRVQSGGRISIPDAERQALDIDEGDIVQTIVIPIDTGDSNE